MSYLTDHYYRMSLSSLIFVPANIGPVTNVGISTGSNGTRAGGIYCVCFWSY
jgi:hypothetical protein